jgi:sulfatase maturation enzyme AslB (radical SAM superfamily)
MSLIGQEIILSINPSYHCNFSCEFCYLTPDQLRDRNRLSLESLSKKLMELEKAQIKIRHVDLYGGEIGLLPLDYLTDLKSRLRPHYDGPINIISNLSYIHPFFLDPDVDMTVSFDFEAREKSDLVFQNMLKFSGPLSVLMLASPELLKKNPDEMISLLNSIQNIQSVEIKPYSSNQANQLIHGFTDFEDFVLKWIRSPIPKRFQFINLNLIESVLDGSRNAYSDDHLYLTPEGHWAVLEFDQNDHEFFLKIENLIEYEAWQLNEKKRVGQNKFCRKCEFLGKCLTEHYRDVKSLDNSCSGFKFLIESYRLQNQKLESPRALQTDDKFHAQN